MTTTEDFPPPEPNGESPADDEDDLTEGGGPNGDKPQ